MKEVSKNTKQNTF